MPMSIQRKRELEEDPAVKSARILREKYKYGQRHYCPVCMAVHHFYDDYCHNQKCKNQGPLRPC